MEINIMMARTVYAEYGERKAKEGGAAINKEWAVKVLAGEADDTHGVQIALAAIAKAIGQ